MKLSTTSYGIAHSAYIDNPLWDRGSGISLHSANRYIDQIARFNLQYQEFLTKRLTAISHPPRPKAPRVA